MRSLSPDGKYLATADSRQRICVWELQKPATFVRGRAA